jgi:exodeoxyribonuclease VII small subunit
MPREAKKRDEPTVESMLKRLDQITERLGAGEVTLDQAADLYGEGVALLSKCKSKLKTTRSKVEKLNRLTGKLESFKVVDVEEH